MDVFGYYAPNDSRYCEVELDEVSEQRSNDSKRVGQRIKIGAEMRIFEEERRRVRMIYDRFTCPEPRIDPPEFDAPRCPVCGEECETIYLN